MVKPFEDRPGHIRLSSRASVGQTCNPPPQTSTWKAVECADAVKRWIEGRGKPLNVRRLNSRRITERLASRVKGLTGLFQVLLLTPPNHTAVQRTL
jgi:hypothetical protein